MGSKPVPLPEAYGENGAELVAEVFLLCSWRWEGRVRVEQPSIPLVPLDDPTDLFPRDSAAVVEMSAARFDTEA